MKFLESRRLRHELENTKLRAEIALSTAKLERTQALQSLEARRGKLLKTIEAWGQKAPEYEMGWFDAIRSGLNPSDHKTPINAQFVTFTMVAQSRELFIKNPFAQSAVFNLQHYVIGQGYNYRKTGADRATALQVQSYWKAWYRLNKWFDCENEIIKRALRDGQAIIEWFGDIPRFVEPRQLIPQSNAPWGITVDENDHTKALVYHICQLDQYGNPDAGSVRHVPAANVSHLKWPLVDVNAIIGLPPFYFYAANLEGAAKCLRNMRELVAIQTAIALIREHPEGISGSEIESWAAEDADKTVVDPDTDDNVFQKKLQPGTMLETKAGEKIHFPAAQMNAATFIEVVSADLRAVAAGLALPEFIFTADAGRSNYASLMAAEGPAVKTFESLQMWLSIFLTDVFDRVVSHAVRRGNQDIQDRWGIGRLPAEVLALNSSVNGPSVRTRDFFPEARTNLIDAQAGVLPPQEWCASKGRDYEEVMTEIEDHKKKHPDIPWPPTLPQQQGQALEDHPDLVPTKANGQDSTSKTKTGSEKRDAGGSGA